MFFKAIGKFIQKHVKQAIISHHEEIKQFAIDEIKKQLAKAKATVKQ